MRIRTQLIVAFLVLAVMPMSAIVLVGYVSSQRAVRQAVEAEASLLTAEMDSRLRRVRGEMEQRVARVGRLPFTTLVEAEEAEAAREREVLFDSLLGELGDAAPLVERFEFIPEAVPHASEAPASPPPPAHRTPPAVVIEMHDVMKEVERSLESIESEEARQKARDRAREGIAAARAAMEMFAREESGDAEAWSMRIRTEDVASLEGRHGGEEVEAIEVSGLEADREFDSFRVSFEDQLSFPVRQEGQVVGRVLAQVKGQELLRRVLARTRRTQGEIPFALDREGKLLTLSEEDAETLSGLPIEASSAGRQVGADWVVVTSEIPAAELSFGIARPIRESLAEIRRTALRNFAFGAGLIGLALLGVLPISARMSRNVQDVTVAAESIAHGDLSVRLPVRSGNEIGQLAIAFNSMAGDLARSRDRLLAEERSRREHEVERSLLQAEIARTSRELEEARRFQLSLLPKRLPEHDHFELAVEMRTATEVGGDYYDFQLAPDGVLTAAVGDATGHGARAGTMVTVIKSLFSAYPPGRSLASFLSEAGAAIRRMDLGRMAMALAVARLEHGKLTVAAAGMPPALIFRKRSHTLEEIALAGMPLGSFASEYRERRVEMQAGDTLLLMTDGLPELPNSAGEPLGYQRAADAFMTHAEGDLAGVIDGLCAVAEEWGGGGPPADDVTFVALRARELAAHAVSGAED